MDTHIAFIRGINVGGQKKFPKAEQINLLESLGFQQFLVYLHTGNWIFQASADSRLLEAQIAEAIFKKYGWEVPVLVRTTSEIDHLLKTCPFPKEKKEQSYFTLLHVAPTPEKIVETVKVNYPGETFHITPSCVFFYPEKGYGKAKLNNNWFEQKLKVMATTRNYNTLNKVLLLAKDL